MKTQETLNQETLNQDAKHILNKLCINLENDSIRMTNEGKGFFIPQNFIDYKDQVELAIKLL